MEDCIFCKIAKGESPATVVYESENVIAFENIRPVADVHILVVPKKHIGTFMDVDDDKLALELIKAVQNVIIKKEIKNGYKIVINGGSYQIVPHLHWHLLGGKLENEDDEINRT